MVIFPLFLTTKNISLHENDEKTGIYTYVLIFKTVLVRTYLVTKPRSSPSPANKNRSLAKQWNVRSFPAKVVR